MKYYRFKKHVLAHHPKEILDLDEFLKLRTEVVKEMDPGLQEDGDELPPGMDLPPGEEGIGGKVTLAVMREICFQGLRQVEVANSFLNYSNQCEYSQ